MSAPGTQTSDDKKQEIAQQNTLLERAMATGDVHLVAQAKQLKADYHARDMAALSDDVYEAADGKNAKVQTEPPVGYIRASATPEALRAAGINWSKEEIADYLQPTDSGFRAEIYLPDPAILGRDAKPVLCFKGTDSDKNEDWLNNARQGAGMQSDYYDRAMTVALRLKKDFGDNQAFEITGHSLGGGLASAAAAVTGAHTTTFNSAGLHPDTAQRFIQGGPLFDTGKTIVAYQVQGEVLTSTQHGVSNMSVMRRAQAGYLAETAAELSRLPGLEEAVTKKIQAYVLIPEPGATEQEKKDIKARSQQLTGDAKELIQYLASHSGNDVLKKMPTAAGIVMPALDAKMRDQHGNLIDKPKALSIGNVGELAGPIADAISVTLMAAKTGRMLGEPIALGGRVTHNMLDKVGDGQQAMFNAQGVVVEKVLTQSASSAGSVVKLQGEAVATGREVIGQAQAAKERVAGNVQSAAYDFSSYVFRKVGFDDLADHYSRAGKNVLTSSEYQARQVTAQAQSDAGKIRGVSNDVAHSITSDAATLGVQQKRLYAGAGELANNSTDAVAHTIRNSTKYAPTIGAAAGGFVASVPSAAAVVGNPLQLYKVDLLARFGPQAFSQATDRHLMTETVRPSLDFKIQQIERELLRNPLMQIDTQQKATPKQAEPSTPNDNKDSKPHASLQPSSDALNKISYPENHPGNQLHPHHAIYHQALSLVHAEDAKRNRQPDDNSERMALSLTGLAAKDGLSRIDHLVFSADNGRGLKAGENVIIVQGELNNLGHDRAHMKTTEAINTPVLASLQSLETIQQQQTSQLQIQNAPVQRGPMLA